MGIKDRIETLEEANWNNPKWTADKIMESLENRIIKLEKHSPTEPTWIIVTHRAGEEVTEEQREAAIERYKREHLDWETTYINIVHLEGDGS